MKKLSKSPNLLSDALWQLMDLVRDKYTIDSAWLYSLTWIAACRLSLGNSDEESLLLLKLQREEIWSEERYSSIPSEAKILLWGQGDLATDKELKKKAIRILVSMIDRHDSHDQSEIINWNVSDLLWDFREFSRTDAFGGMAMAPELCDLAFEMLDPQAGKTIWIPFDATGQLVIRAAKRGLQVNAYGPGRRLSTQLQLLLAIERANGSIPLEVNFEEPPTEENRRVFLDDYLISVPPFGMKIQPGMGWHQWEGEPEENHQLESLSRRIGPFLQLQLDRSETWSVAAFWPHVKERAIFIVTPNVLFGKGQEEKLRQNILSESNALFAVATLPNRLFNVSNIASAMLCMERKPVGQFVRFVDASDLTFDSKSSMKSSRILDRERVVRLMLGRVDDPDVACSVGLQDIAKQDFNLLPMRYLRNTFLGGGEQRQPLGELVTVVRAPVIAKDVTAIDVQEAGFSELDGWQMVVGPCLKTSAMQPRKIKDSMLKNGDILISIKGTLGKSALIGNVPSLGSGFLPNYIRQADQSISNDIKLAPLVPAQSCIALRLKVDTIDPIVLFLFFRSNDFKKQIESLRSGATVAHVTPSTLLQEILIPILPLQESEKYLKLYAELCELENSVKAAQKRIDEIRETLWAND
jgi:type I restriction-modification system DNA methylase subunit